MSKLGICAGIVLLVVAVYFGRKELVRREREAFRRTVERSRHTLDAIKEHAKEFSEKEIVKVTDNVYMAIGFALANSIMLVGKTGIVIVDVTESAEAAAEIFKEFRKITKKPVTDIIYTHNHADHVHGAKSFLEEGVPMPNVWAHASIGKAWRNQMAGVSAAHFHRSMRQFGVFLPDTVSAGIGHKLDFGTALKNIAIIYPNKLVEGDGQDVVLAGVPMRIIHIPGETDDTIGVWLPGDRAFLCADDIYKAFPNLYAIRGTKSRVLMQWVHSIDKMIDLEAEHLVPSHTRPVSGREKIRNLMIDYRDAIQYVHDQSVRLMNHGYHPDEIANKVKLPAALLRNHYLDEFYGTVKWSAKSVFIDYQGWFSGDPVELDPLTRGERADKMVELVGAKKLVETAKEAAKNGEYQWALELAAHMLRNDPGNSEARNIKVEALVELGSRLQSCNGRNYYLTAAMETATGTKITLPADAKMATVEAMPVSFTFDAMSVKLNPEDCETRNETVYFRLTKPDSHHSIQLRHGVAIVRHQEPKHYHIKFTTTENKWKEIAGGGASALVAIGTGDVTIEGGHIAFKSFIDCFDRDSDYYDL